MGNGREIQFYYTADGELLRKLVYDPANIEGYWQEYINGVEYKNWVMSRFTHPEGAVVLNATGGYEYEYVMKDHLGNNRVVFSDKNNDRTIDATDIKDINNFYPFGLDMEGNWKIVSSNKYKFNGKELTSEFGLGWYNYGARFYDAAIGRWNVVDPLSEKYFSSTPYNYVNNSPIKFTDPTGMSGKSTHTDKDGNVVAVYNDGDMGVYKHEDWDKDSKTYGSIINTSANGQKMGETLTWNSFTDEFNNKIGKIKFGSNEASARRMK